MPDEDLEGRVGIGVEGEGETLLLLLPRQQQLKPAYALSYAEEAQVGGVLTTLWLGLELRRLLELLLAFAVEETEI